MTVAAFRSSAGIVDRSDRGKLQFTGEQAHWFLDQLVTNQVEGLEAGQGVEALLLTPKGRITAVMRLLSSGKSVFADVNPGQAAELRDFFEGRVFTTQVEVKDRTEEFALLSVLGPRADEIVGEALSRFVASESGEDRALGSNLPGDAEHHTVHFGSVALIRVLRPTRGIDLWIRAESAVEVTALLEEAGGQLASIDDYAALCVLEGQPRFGVDFDEGYLPQEAAIERAVHFQKGCYLGQEAVAMAQRGRVKRRLRHLEFQGEPALGTLSHAGADAGAVTSIGTDDGRSFGIATVKTSVEVGSEVEVAVDSGPVRATVHELPGTSEGPSVPSARELRERLRG